VTLYDFARGTRLGPAEVLEKYGVRPDQVADLLGLAGDPVDNIPGIPGVGAKTAAALLAVTGDLPGALARLDEVAGLPIRGARALAARLAEHRDLALLSRRLATVVTDAPFDADPESLRYRGADRDRAGELFDRLGFGRIRERVPRWRAEDES
jgi:5'-3' exonuclease